MKQCNDCQKKKPATTKQFVPAKQSPDGLSYECRDCRNKKQRQRYAADKGKHRVKMHKQLKKKQGKLNELKTPCVNCGWFDFPQGIDFHHIDPNDKVGNVSTLAATAGWDAVEAEIAKCVCLCANCHRGVHHGKVFV